MNEKGFIGRVNITDANDSSADSVGLRVITKEGIISERGRGAVNERGRNKEMKRRVAKKYRKI
jgi:hypothetical protein